MFGRGEKVGRGERLSRGRARKVGENVKDAVNVGMGESAEELGRYFASRDDFGADPEMAADIAAAERVLSWLPEDERTSAEVIGKLKEKAARRKWDNYIGAALTAKDKEIGSMLTDEEREAEKRAAKEKMLSAEKRAEKERKVAEKARGRKGFLRARMKLVAGLVGMGASMFLSACGASTEKEMRVANAAMFGGEDGDDDTDDGEVITSEMVGETSAVAERPAGVSPGVNDETIGDETMRSLDEILELSKSCNLMEFTAEELELAGNDPELLAKFESSEESRVLENGLQLNYSEGYYSENKTGNKFGPSQVDVWDLKEGRDEAFVDSLMSMVFSQPQELAAQVGELDMILLAAGVDESVFAVEGAVERAQAVYEQMLNREDGGALQARLRGALKLALLNDRTSFNYYLENKIEDTFYLRPVDASTTESPETNLVLMANTLQRHNAKQIQVVFDYGDISEYVAEYSSIFGLDRYEGIDFANYKETVDDNADCGYQPCFNERMQPKQEIVKITTQEEVVEVVEESEIPDGEPEKPETPETPDNTPETPDDTPETPTNPSGDGDKEEGEEDDDDKKDEEDDDKEEDEDDGEEEDPVEDPTDEETKRAKDPENKTEIANGGEATNVVGKTDDVDNLKDQGILPATNVGSDEQIPQEEITGDQTGTYEVTDEPLIGGVNGDGKVAGTDEAGGGESEGENGETGYNAAVVEGETDDEGMTDEEKAAAAEAEKKATDGEISGDITPEEFADFLKGYADELYGMGNGS